MRAPLALGLAGLLLAGCGTGVPTPTRAPSLAGGQVVPTTTPTPASWTPTPTADPQGDLGPTVRRLDRLGNTLGLGSGPTATPQLWTPTPAR